MGTGQAKISVTIPVYNCEKYIVECASSLMEQTYKNIEYIFVDDASTDHSLQLLKETVNNYPDRVEQVKIISLPHNTGLANARNTGINGMTGDYFTFCDGDDWIEKDAFNTMLVKAEAENADIVCTPFFIDTLKKRKKVSLPPYKKWDLNNIPLDTVHFSLWNKLFKSKLFHDNNLRVFDMVNCWEDLSITSRIFSLTQNIVILDIPFYHYRKQDNASLTTSGHKRILKDHIICAQKLDEWFSAQGQDFYNRYTGFLLFLKFTSKIKILRGREKDITTWKETFPESNTHILAYKHIPKHFRILFHLAYILPTGFTQYMADRFQIFYE